MVFEVEILFAGLVVRREAMEGSDRLGSEWHETTKDMLVFSSQGEHLGLDFTADGAIPLVYR